MGSGIRSAPCEPSYEMPVLHRLLGTGDDADPHGRASGTELSSDGYRFVGYSGMVLSVLLL